MYVMDVLEEMGTDIAHRVYWDAGPWSDLHRRWRPVPENISLPNVLFTPLDEKSAAIRLARCLSEIVIEACNLCEKAFEEAYIRISKKLGPLCRTESVGRPVWFSESSESISPDLLRNYCCFATGCPPFKNKGVVSVIQCLDRPHILVSLLPEGIGRGIFSVAQLHQWLLSLLSLGSPSYQEIAVMALGNCNSDSYEILANEIKNIMTQDPGKDRGNRGKQATKSKMEEMRLSTANVFRIIADQMPRGTLRYRKRLRQSLLDFVVKTLNFVKQLPLGSLVESIAHLPPEFSAQDCLQLCYCLCSVAANAGSEIIGVSGQDGLSVEFRRVFFQTVQQWNKPGGNSGTFFRFLFHR